MVVEVGRSRSTAKATRNMVHLRVPVNVESSVVQSNGVLPGRNETPFNIPLPLHLPSSMVCNGPESHCRVQYLIRAKLQSSGTF